VGCGTPAPSRMEQSVDVGGELLQLDRGEPGATARRALSPREGDTPHQPGRDSRYMLTPAPLGNPRVPVVSRSGVRSVLRLVQEVVMRLGKTTIGFAGLLVCLIAGVSVAFGQGSTTPAGGKIQLFVQPGNGQGKGKILLTGAIGDYGSSSPTESSGGKKFGVATLKKGTIKIDLTAISAKVNKGSGAIFDAATCSYSPSADRKRHWGLRWHSGNDPDHGDVRFHRLALQERSEEG
jgi:hypothetical protein